MVAMAMVLLLMVEADLLQCSNKQVVDFVIEYGRYFNVLAAVVMRQ
jgi:hypothetical protein